MIAGTTENILHQKNHMTQVKFNPQQMPTQLQISSLTITMTHSKGLWTRKKSLSLQSSKLSPKISKSKKVRNQPLKSWRNTKANISIKLWAKTTFNKRGENHRIGYWTIAIMIKTHFIIGIQTKAIKMDPEIQISRAKISKKPRKNWNLAY